ncbi:hypothetical protein TNCV_2388981 [Trichonephila clavipes]|nr:hypothetical protein TNCV_2388981 [Trichonephila clavipes]
MTAQLSPTKVIRAKGGGSPRSEPNWLDSAKKLSMENTFIFQQDNDPKHTAIVTKTWFLYRAPRRLETPLQSPDLNPIENL